MYRPFKPQDETEESRTHRELGTWAWDSHLWVETAPGYAKCQWCCAQHTSEMGIGYDFPLCPKNPRIQLRDAYAISQVKKAQSEIRAVLENSITSIRGEDA